MSATIITTMAIFIAIILFSALVRQTMRAERAEAALDRIELTIASCERAMTAKLILDRARDAARKAV